jgi:hypothetical protein
MDAYDALMMIDWYSEEVDYTAIEEFGYMLQPAV